MNPLAFRILQAGLLLAAAVSAPTHAASRTLFVANNGVDGVDCGLILQVPCRSITQAIANALPGDTVMVGPGQYGDANRDGDLGDPGDERGSPGCGCMLSVNKEVILISSDGAGATLIALPYGSSISPGPISPVLLIMDNGEFGRPGHGFTVMQHNPDFEVPVLAIDSHNIKVRGNVIAGPELSDDGTSGIVTVDGPGTVLIEGNLVTDTFQGIRALGSGKTVRANVVQRNYRGIQAGGAVSVIGNLATSNTTGIRADRTGVKITGNAVHGNSWGIDVQAIGQFVDATVQGNNISGNGASAFPNCGLHLFNATALATDNYWGSASGPGGTRADNVCGPAGGAATTAPFATRPFPIHVAVALSDDLAPDPFDFTNKTLVVPGVDSSSNIVTIHGIDAPAPISIAGGSFARYRINGAAWVNTPGTVSAGDTVQLVDRIPSGTLLKPASAVMTVTIGGFTDTRRITNGAQ